MKLLLICICVLFLSFPVLAQELSLRNLLQLREMELTKVDRKLSRKGWKFMSDSKPSDGMMGKAVWAYKPGGAEATAWCVVYYSDTSPSRILYNISGGNAVQKIGKKFRRRKMRPISEGHSLEGVEQLEYFADYPDDKFVFRMLKYKQIDYSGIKIFEKTDYEKAKANGRLLFNTWWRLHSATARAVKGSGQRFVLHKDTAAFGELGSATIYKKFMSLRK